ncbi:MAG: hypothetical protein HC767_05515, partial [Akkermansiaceae bacterium]|nr:hypothetical protein [Akkermansiaceae bacterium]
MRSYFSQLCVLLTGIASGVIEPASGDIDEIVRQERTTLFQVGLVAVLVMLVSSFYLAGTIGEPVRKLAAAADRVR